MILPFKTEINGKPTFFVEKIWNGLSLIYKGVTVDDYAGFKTLHVSRFGKMWDSIPNDLDNEKAKIHTIRQDKNNRWKVDNQIHFVINNRSADYFQFAPIMPVKHIQAIRIEYSEKELWPVIKIDDHIHLIPEKIFEYYDEVSKIAQNDGFDSLEEFLQFFNSNFEGKIIHWTDNTY